MVTQFADRTLGFLDRASGWDNRDRIDLLALDRLIKGDLRLVDEDDVTGALGDVLVEQGFDVTQMFVLADAKPGIDLAVRADAIHNLTAGGLMLQARFAHLGGHRAGRGARA